MSELKAKGLKMIAEGILLIAKSLEESPASKTTATAKPEKAVKTTAEKPAEEIEDDESGESATYTAEDLDGMTYNDIKKLAKSLGISAVGNRETIVAAILASSGATEDESESDEEFEECEVLDDDSEDESDDDAEDDDEGDDDDDDEDSDDVAAQVNAAVEDMTDDEIRALLEDSDLSTKGKRQALIARLIEAVEDGIIEFSDDEDEEDEPDDADAEEDAEESDESEDISEDMTPARREAYDEICKDTEEGFESGEISREDLIEFINDFNGEKGNYKKTPDAELLDIYLRCCAFLISDDGEVSEDSGKYEINGESYCCGHPLVWDEKKKSFVCQSCGAKYKA